MTPFDYAFLAILATFTITGLMRGFVRELFGLVGWLAALWAGARFGSLAEPLLAGQVENPRTRGLLACIIVGVAVFAVCSIIGLVLHRAMKDSVLAPINRMLGLLLGGARAVVIIGFTTFVGMQLGFDKQPWWEGARFKSSAADAALMLDKVVDFKALIKDQRLFEMPGLPGMDPGAPPDLLEQMKKLKEMSEQPAPAPEG